MRKLFCLLEFDKLPVSFLLASGVITWLPSIPAFIPTSEIVSKTWNSYRGKMILGSLRCSGRKKKTRIYFQVDKWNCLMIFNKYRTVVWWKCYKGQRNFHKLLLNISQSMERFFTNLAGATNQQKKKFRRHLMKILQINDNRPTKIGQLANMPSMYEQVCKNIGKIFHKFLTNLQNEQQIF